MLMTEKKFHLNMTVKKGICKPISSNIRLFVLLSNENYRSILESALPCEYSPSADCDPEERAAPAAFTFTYFVRYRDIFILSSFPRTPTTRL